MRFLIAVLESPQSLVSWRRAERGSANKLDDHDSSNAFGVQQVLGVEVGCEVNEVVLKRL
jgi:hypothetical protein